MASTINLDNDFISAEELQLLKTKHAILEKLRARFGEYSHRDGWAVQWPEAKEFQSQRKDSSL